MSFSDRRLICVKRDLREIRHFLKTDKHLNRLRAPIAPLIGHHPGRKNLRYSRYSLIPGRTNPNWAQQQEHFLDSGDQHRPQVVPSGVPPSPPCAGCCTRGMRFGPCRNRPQSSGAHGPHARPWQSRGRRCRIPDTCAASVRGGAGCRTWVWRLMQRVLQQPSCGLESD